MLVELLSILKSSCQEVFCKKGVFNFFLKFTGKHLCQSLSFNKVADFRPEIQKISKSTFYYRTPLVAASKSFSENLLLWMLTLNFYANETLSLTELDVKFALNLVHKCLPIFPQKKQIFYYSPDYVIKGFSWGWRLVIFADHWNTNDLKVTRHKFITIHFFFLK